MKNLCSACGEDFGTMESFDSHRKGIRIVNTHSLRECAKMHKEKRHPRGECQRLVGVCLEPASQGLRCTSERVWYTPEGLARVEALSANLVYAREARKRD